MHSGMVKRFGTFLLVSSIWFSGVLFMPSASNAQTTDDKAKPAEKSKKEKKAEKSAAASPTATPVNGPLSPKDDPGQIGKRNINGGSDKLFGWLGGSQEKEIQIGRQLAMEIEQQAKMVEDPIITEYVNRVGQNIVLHSDAKIPFTIKVIDSDEVNAFALPGGFFFVNKGLILAADNEAELAGVMAHEIAHVAARHAMENQGKGQLLQYGILAGVLLTGGIAGSVLQNTAGIAQALALLKFSRGAEVEADKLGVQYLYAAGYDPTGMSTMFEKLASKNRKKPGTISKLFSSHPPSMERRDDSLELVARFAEKEEYIISTSEFQRVRGHLMKITNAKAGVLADVDEEGDTKPTLKKRQPEPTDDPAIADPGSSTSDGPPKLKKRNEPTSQPSPSPTPGN
ncbi:MAG: M48 family metalloprotease [Pyrinomonadaceae bacterium]|nr:M48 family metalloprotease [Pyrinomonadaceae bacterium]MBP6213537.1 M48 family metalloprotease [Pyrinomonadaceae bacterium]